MSERPFKLSKRPRVNAPVVLSSEWGMHLDDLLASGSLTQALEYANPHGSPLDWDGGEAMATGSRLLYQAGADRASHLQVARTFRKYPEHIRVIRAWTWYLWRRGSPLRVWQFLQSIDPAKYSAQDAAIIWRRRSSSFLDYRDFKGAGDANKKAAGLTSRDSNFFWQQARIHWGEDRLEEALTMARESLALDPRQTDLISLTAQVLQKLARDDELEAFLREALTWSEDRFLLYPLISLYFEQKRYAETLPLLERLATCTPWAEPPVDHWRHSRLFDAYYYQGDFERARFYAEKIGQGFYRETSRRLTEPPINAQRLHIAVPFVGQEFRTCGPATLVALARYWGRELEQAEVVKDIWYNGTVDWRERQWCEKQGLFAREFRVTWEATRCLLIAGFPFAVGTAGPGWAHLQAAIGFDDWRNSLYVREPSSRAYNEYEQASWLKQQTWFGPRGLVFAPLERAAQLAAIELPDADLYDDSYRMFLALEKHQRAEAADLVTRLRTKAPDHGMTLNAERRLADYDENGPVRLSSIRRLRALFPESQELALIELSVLRSEGTAQDRISLLQSFTGRKDCNSLLRMELAEELQSDARSYGRARTELWRAHSGYNTARILRAFANLEWECGNRDEATQYYHFAFTHEPLVEYHADSYFKALRLTGHTEDGLTLLRERFGRQKNTSGNPAQTLAIALELSEQLTAALAVIEEAITSRPTDLDLRVWAVEFAARHNLREQGAAWLSGAGTQGESPAWLRAAARLALAEGRPADALRYWRQVAASAPTNVIAHQEIAALLSRLEGKPSTLAHLRAIADLFPHHVILQRLLISWLRMEDRSQVVLELERILTLHPEDCWLRRELADQLAELGRPDEAEAYAQEALAREPLNRASLNIAGFVAICRKDFAAARGHFQSAIQLDANNTYAIEKLLTLGATRQDSDTDLAFIENELARQDYPAEGVREFANRTWDSNTPERAITLLQNALRVNSGAWINHASYSTILLRLGRIEEAYAAAKLCAERYPLNAGSWSLIVYACFARQDLKERIEAAEMAVKLNPEGENCIEELGSAYAAAGSFSDELQLYHRVLARCPHIAVFHSLCAQALARAGRTAEAIAGIQRSLELAPGNNSTWSYLDAWGGRDACLAQARSLTKTRPGDAQVWLALAGC